MTDIRHVTDPDELYKLAAAQQRERIEAAQSEAEVLDDDEIEDEIARRTKLLTDPADLYALAAYEQKFKQYKAAQ